MNSTQGERRAKRKCEMCLILINPSPTLPFHQSPQFPVNSGKFTLELFVTCRFQMLRYVVTFEGDEKSIYSLW